MKYFLRPLILLLFVFLPACNPDSKDRAESEQDRAESGQSRAESEQAKENKIPPEELFDSQESLTRDKAKVILSNSLANKRVAYITIGGDDGLKALESGGIVYRDTSGALGSAWRLTSAGIESFSELSPAANILFYPSMYGVVPYLTLEIEGPVYAKPLEITGIRKQGDEQIVSYLAGFEFPDATPKIITGSFYKTMNTSAIFRKYDDGWRCSHTGVVTRE